MAKHIYFLGIGGSLMGSLAILAKQRGFMVSGSDGPLYPPMSEQLNDAGIKVFEGFEAAQLKPAPDLIVVGNANLPRGKPSLECVLESGIPYVSGAQWLGNDILQNRWVLAAAGTHGKTTTSSMLAWILESAGLRPGFLIGGVANNFGISARLGDSPFFVVEADEYDTSYFDRRSKFVHYRPRTLIINNLEYDHADIFPDLATIQTQFHHLVRTIPASGLIIAPENQESVETVLKQGCWTPVARVREVAKTNTRKSSKTSNVEGELWYAQLSSADGSNFEVHLRSNGKDQSMGQVQWNNIGLHNVSNALNVIAAARHAGVIPEQAIEALSEFQGVKRRLEILYDQPDCVVYDDFAHHPTAIRTTLQGLRARYPTDEILAVVEPRTHTMSMGTHRNDLANCCAAADSIIWFRGDNIKWDLHKVVKESVIPATISNDTKVLVKQLVNLPTHKRRRHIVFMSNGGFDGIHKKLVEALTAKAR